MFKLFIAIAIVFGCHSTPTPVVPTATQVPTEMPTATELPTFTATVLPTSEPTATTVVITETVVPTQVPTYAPPVVTTTPEVLPQTGKNGGFGWIEIAVLLAIGILMIVVWLVNLVSTKMEGYTIEPVTDTSYGLYYEDELYHHAFDEPFQSRKWHSLYEVVSIYIGVFIARL